MDVIGGMAVTELAGDGVGLGDFFRFEPLALEHVQEIGVAAEIQLIGAIETDAAFARTDSSDTR